MDGTLTGAWPGAKSFRPKLGPEADAQAFRGQRRSNRTQRSKTTPGAGVAQGTRAAGAAGLLGPCAGGEPSGAGRGRHGHTTGWHARGGRAFADGLAPAARTPPPGHTCGGPDFRSARSGGSRAPSGGKGECGARPASQRAIARRGGSPARSKLRSAGGSCRTSLPDAVGERGSGV